MKITPDNLRGADARSRSTRSMPACRPGRSPTASSTAALFFPQGEDEYSRVGEMVGGIMGRGVDRDLRRHRAHRHLRLEGQGVRSRQHGAAQPDRGPQDPGGSSSATTPTASRRSRSSARASCRASCRPARSGCCSRPSCIAARACSTAGANRSSSTTPTTTTSTDIFQENPDHWSNRKGLRIRDEIRMVRPGFYLGRAYHQPRLRPELHAAQRGGRRGAGGRLPRRRRRRRGLLAGGRADLGLGRLSAAMPRRAASAWLILLRPAGGWLPATPATAALAGRQPAAPVLAVDPDEPGPSLPPVGRSLFDFLTMREEGRPRRSRSCRSRSRRCSRRSRPRSAGPAPSLQKVLIPLGRSLQRNAANPDFFAFPRAVVAVDREPALRPGASGMLLAGPALSRLPGEGRDHRGDQLQRGGRAGSSIQVVRDYREGGAAEVYYADRPTCIACHRNHAPIFSKPLWDETNANAAIAATLAALQDEFYGIPVARGVDIPNAFDAATDRANSFAALQRIWQEGCELPDAPADGVACRADALLAVLQYKLAGNRHPAPDRNGPGKAFAAALRRQWDALWPGGLALPDGDVPNRVPLAAPLDPHVPLSEAEAHPAHHASSAHSSRSSRARRARSGMPRQRRAGPAAGRRARAVHRERRHPAARRFLVAAQDAPTSDIEATCEIATRRPRGRAPRDPHRLPRARGPGAARLRPAAGRRGARRRDRPPAGRRPRS